MINSFVTYFISTYKVVIDQEMLRNSLQTNLNESLDLFSINLIIIVLFLGVIPSIFVYYIKLEKLNLKQSIIG